MDESLIHKFGFSEMYEWADIPTCTSKLGKIVQFDKTVPNKVRLYDGKGIICGITTINSAIDSDDPDHWYAENMFNEYGDLYLRKEKLAVGVKQYDHVNEISYVQTKPWEHLVPLKHPTFDPDAKYIKRSNRGEWVRVNLLGKCIIEDDGTCVPGEYCTPVVSKLVKKQGTVTKAKPNSKIKLYVMKRISENTILVINKCTL